MRTRKAQKSDARLLNTALQSHSFMYAISAPVVFLLKTDCPSHVSEAVQVNINSYYTNGILEREIFFKHLGAITILESDEAIGTNLMSVLVSTYFLRCRLFHRILCMTYKLNLHALSLLWIIFPPSYFINIWLIKTNREGRFLCFFNN